MEENVRRHRPIVEVSGMASVGVLPESQRRMDGAA
jgi:hypothetical protein